MVMLADNSPLIPLYAYQRRWLEDHARAKAGFWTRSAGKTFVISLEPIVACQLAEAERRPTTWFCFASAEVQTKEIVRYAAIHAQALDLGRAMQLVDEEHDVVEPDGTKKRIAMLSIEFEHGSRFVGLPTNPYSIRGKHGNLIGDEAGHWPHAEELWTAAAPIASREQYKVRICGTAGARRGPFYEIIAENRAGWTIHKLDVYEAIAQGCPIKLDDIQALVGKGRKFRTEYGLQWEDEESRLIPLELLIAAERFDTLLVPEVEIDEERPERWKHLLDPNLGDTRFPYDSPTAWARLFESLANKPNLYLGLDVARKRDLTSLIITERDGFFRRVRARIAMRKRRFAEQRACLWAAMRHVRRGCIDATGIGAQLAEESVEKWGTARVEAVTFTAPVKEDLATRVLRGFEDRCAVLPRSPAMRESLHAVFKLTTPSGATRYDATATEEHGHADDFWAFALSLLAAGDGRDGALGIQSFGAPTWTRERSFLP